MRKKRKINHQELLGVYPNFPAIIHGEASLSYNFSIIKLQQIIIQGLYKLNGFSELCSLSMPNQLGMCDGKLGFEVGLANSLFFDFFSATQKSLLTDKLNSGEPFSLLDFLVIVTYHYLDEGKTKPLKFDYFLLRFLFSRGRFKLQTFHERGSQRIAVQELIEHILAVINQEAKQLGLNSFHVEYIRAV